MKQSRCYCGNPKSFQHCCAPILSGQFFASTAEQLMRSRFSAFSTANIDYLIATLHSSKRTSDDRQHLNDSIDQCRWLQLTIHNTTQGQADDQQGEVEFTATYTQADKLYQLREKSIFIKDHGQWFYLDGVEAVEKPQKHPFSSRKTHFIIIK